MDWPRAIEKNREALLRIVATLFAMAGLTETTAAATLPRHLRNAIVRILRPAESAARRLIIMSARGVEVVLRPSGGRRQVPSDPARRKATSPNAGAGAQARSLSFPLIDPHKRFDFRPIRKKPKGYPRISVIGISEPRPIPENWIPTPHDEIDAGRLCLRLAALKRALDDLPGQAKRLARWRAKRELGLSRSTYSSPMRPGRPPGYRKRRFHDVDDLLRECHSLAVYARRLDTS